MADKAENQEGLQAAIAEAVESSDYNPAGPADAQQQGESPESSAATEPAQPETQGESTPSTVATSEAPAPAEREAQSDLPDVYWGTDLTGLSDEQKQAVIARFEQNESYIRTLQEQLNKEPERPARPEAPEPVEVTDDDLLRAAGYDPEDIEVQQSRSFIVPLLRNQLALEERVEAQERYVAETQAETYWNQELDALEATYGKLPGDRLNVLKRAVDERIASPHELYFRLSAPARREVGDFVSELRQKQQREAGQRDAGGQLRPTTAGATETGITKGMSLREATKVAAEEAAKETKLSWVDAVRGRVARGAQGPSAPPGA